MGILIEFNREEAIAAGMRIESKPNATPEEILEFIEEIGTNILPHDAYYLAWLQASSWYLHLPNRHVHTGYLVSLENNGTVVRVRQYSALFVFLRTHNINWEEF